MKVPFPVVLSILFGPLLSCTSAADPPAGNTLRDDFRVEVPNRWDAVLGKPWTVQNGEFASTADPATYLKGMVVCDFPMADGEMGAVVRPAAYETRSVGLVGKYIDADRHWFLRIVWWQGSIIIKGDKERTIFLGPFSLRDKEAKGLIEEPLHLRAVTRDGRIGIFINGVLRCVFDDPYPGEPGRPGLYTEANSVATSFHARRFAP